MKTRLCRLMVVELLLQVTGTIVVADEVPEPMAEEVTETPLDADSVRVERIVSHGHASPQDFWYDQDQHEWVVVLSGVAKLRFEDETVEM